jgi:hypothetical protein
MQGSLSHFKLHKREETPVRQNGFTGVRVTEGNKYALNEVFVAALHKQTKKIKFMEKLEELKPVRVSSAKIQKRKEAEAL